MKKFLFSKKGLVLLAALVVAVAASIGAYAYFSNSGSGTDSTAQVGSVTNAFTVAVGAPTGGTLYPTSASSLNAVTDTYTVTVTNNDEAAENLHSLKYEVTGTSDALCGASNFSVDGQADGASHTVVYDDDLAPNSDGSPADQAQHSFTVRMDDTGLNQDHCQGVTVNVKATAA
jgi:hypothetical protein